jgi:adenylate kinase family enzyme
MLEKIERWIRLLPPQELEQPFFVIDGVSMTPLKLLSEVRAGTELGRKAQAYWESRVLGTEEEMLVERLKSRLSRYPQDKPLFIVLGVPSKLTPRQLITEIEARSDIGKEWIEKERAYLVYLDSLKRR